MKKGKELGLAISEAIDLKIGSGAVASKADIAKHFNVKPPAIYTWTKNGSISKEKLPEMFRYFSDVVDAGHWGLVSFNDFGGLDAEPIKSDKVPLYTIPEWNRVEDIENLTPEDFVICPVPDFGKRTYAIKCRDNSMMNADSRGSLCRDDLLFIDPDIEPQRDDFVFATSSKYELASIKLLMEQDGRQFLYTSNPTWQKQFILIDNTTKIYGTVIAKSRIFK